LLPTWLRGDEVFDEKSVSEWIDEAVVFRYPLPALVRDLLAQVDDVRKTDPAAGRTADLLRLRRDEMLDNPARFEPCMKLLPRSGQIEGHLKPLGSVPTKMYSGQLPLFPIIYKLEVHFDDALDLPPIVWDSNLPRHPSQFRVLKDHPLHDRAWIDVEYQLHAY